MRIWSEQLIQKLCQKHLCAMWREGLGAYKIITENIDCSYKNHPAVKEFEEAPLLLWHTLNYVREEMLRRGYKPRPMPKKFFRKRAAEYHYEWQTLEEQIQILKNKKCKCNI